MTVCLLLAAGSSSRMQNTGREAIPKMLLPFNGKTFLQHAIDEIKNSNAGDLVVVTGCYHSQLEKFLHQQQIDFIENKNWAEGMGNSIQTGMRYIMDKYPHATDVIILVCDQPYISSVLLNELKNSASQTGKGIIASAYDGTIGTPVLFHKKYFGHLAGLSGHHGAKKIIQSFNADVEMVNFPLGSFDIDTPQDYDRLRAI